VFIESLARPKKVRAIRLRKPGELIKRLRTFQARKQSVTLSRRLRKLAGGLTSRAVLEKSAAMQMVDAHFPTSDARELVFRRYTQPEKDQKIAGATGLAVARASPDTDYVQRLAGGADELRKFWCTPLERLACFPSACVTRTAPVAKVRLAVTCPWLASFFRGHLRSLGLAAASFVRCQKRFASRGQT
jgi:hypothetical protein